MKKINGQIVLKEEDIALIKSAFSSTSKEGTEHLSDVTLDNYYAILDLCVTDDGTYTPYLTLALYDKTDDYMLCDLDIEFENVNDIFRVYMFEIDDISLNITITKEEISNKAKEEVSISSLLKEVESLKSQINILQQIVTIKDEQIQQKNSEIQKLESRLLAVNKMRGSIREAMNKFDDEILKY